jgi:hypothetical protein
MTANGGVLPRDSSGVDAYDRVIPGSGDRGDICASATLTAAMGWIADGWPCSSDKVGAHLHNPHATAPTHASTTCEIDA